MQIKRWGGKSKKPNEQKKKTSLVNMKREIRVGSLGKWEEMSLISLFSPPIVISSAAGPGLRGEEKHYRGDQKSKHRPCQWVRCSPKLTRVIKQIVFL